MEVASILHIHPIFLRDTFKLQEKKATSFCHSILTASVKNGKWDPETRIFLSNQYMKEQMYFENLQLIMQATQSQQSIDPNYQWALQVQTTDADIVEANLHGSTDLDVKIVEAGQNGNNGDASTPTEDTGSTRTSKVKKFAEEAKREMII